MREAMWLGLAFASSVAGMAWLALAMKGHWQQVRADAGLSNARAIALRSLGVCALSLSLWLYLEVDHGSMASLVWVMSLAASALIVAFVLTWRPRWLRVFIGGSNGPTPKVNTDEWSR